MLISLLIAGIVYSCAPAYSVVVFEVLEPATVSLPPRVERILILNRAPLSMDVFEEKDRRGLNEKQLVLVDTMIINSLRKGLEASLRNTPIERFQDPVWVEDRRSDTTAFRELALTKREVNILCEEWNVQAIISLEAYFLDLDDYVDYFTDGSEIATLYYEVSTRLYWNIYLQNSPRPFDRYTMADTLYFTEIRNGMLEKYYTPGEIIREAFSVAGHKYGNYLVPVWYPASRMLYKGGDDSLKLAATFSEEGRWEDAYRIWEDLGRGRDSTLAAKALNNMAVYQELGDHLDSASKLVNRALDLDSLDLLKLYRDELDTRIENREELNQQVY